MNATIATAAPRSFAAKVLQLVGSDLRRFRLLVSMVVALEVLRAALAEWALHGVPARIGEGFGGVFGMAETAILDAVLWLATVLTAAIIVQADLPSDDRAFWRTRPIPPLALAAAKLATCLLLLVAVPWMVNAGRLLAYGAPVSSLFASGLQFVVLAGYVFVPAWVLAVVTRTLPRMIAVGLGLLVGVYLSTGAFLYWWTLWSGHAGGVGAIGIGPPFVLLDWQRLDARGWWGALLMTAAALGIVVAHYEHRRRAISIAAAAVLLAGSWTMPAGEGLSPAPEALARRVSGHLDVVGIGLPPQSLIESRLRSSMAYPVPLTARLTLPPLPSDISASVLLRQIRLQGRRTIAPRDAWQCCFGAGVIGVVAPALAERPSAERLPPSTSQGFEVDIADLDDLRDRAVALEADAEVRLVQHRFAAEIALRPGAAVRVGDRLIEVLDFEPRRSALLVRYTEFPAVSGPLDSDLALFVGDRTRNSVSETTLGWGGSSVKEMITGPGRKSSGRNWVARRHVLVSGAKVLGADVKLYIVETRAIGTVRTPVTKTGLRFWTASEASPR